MSTATSSARLPAIVFPEHYDLMYHHIDLVQHTFQGTIAMKCKALVSLQDAVALKLHAAELQLVKATMAKAASADQTDAAVSPAAAGVQAEEFRYHFRDQTCELIFNGLSLVKDQAYVLTIDFHGILNDQMRGFYRSTYHALDGSTRTMATTQFEATDARRAFPCIDEPALKATFCVKVTIPAHLQCISNTPMAATYSQYEHGVATKTIVFQTTPKMSTYLLAYVIGEFDAISKTSRQIVTTVYTVPGKAHQGQFCLDLASDCLDYYQDLFGIPYPLIKSDLLAIPDFAAGAMENWGCNTYREAKILVEEGTTSESTRRGIARTVCHELAHQWFGNLVTMEWWTQLYLKEGMARFMEFVGIDHLFPEWEAWVEFVQSVYGLALSLDAMKSSHPVEVEVHHPDEISEIFDTISYAKGASIIRMVEAFVGKDVFFHGLRAYLERHKYGNAVTADFWQALDDESGQPIVKFMLPWTQHIGFPIVQLEEDGSIHVSKFLGSGPESPEPDEHCRWPIPVTARVQDIAEEQGPWVLYGPNGDQSQELSDKIKEWSSANKWFKLNVDQTGFFRVAYTMEQWQKFATIMDPASSPLSTTDRLGLLSDSFAAGRAGYSPIVDSLILISKFGEHEIAEYALWEELSENLSALARLFRSEPFYPKLQAFLRNIYAKQMGQLGWSSKPGEGSRIGTLRATVISMMGKSGDTDMMRQAFDTFMAYVADPVGSPIVGDLQIAIFRDALRHDEATVLNALRIIYEDVKTSPEVKRHCLEVMGCVKDPQRHADILDYVFWSGKVRLQDIAFPLGSLASSTDEGGVVIWEYFRSQYAELHEKIGEGSTVWSACVGLCCSGILTTEKADEVEAFFADPKHPAGSAKRRLDQALEVVRTRFIRRERDRHGVSEFLRNL